MTNKLEQLLTEKQMKRLIESGLNKATVYHRIMYSKWDIDKAIDTPADKRFGRKQGYRMMYGNKVTDEQIAIATKNGISHETLSYRLKTGMSVEKAITKKVGGKNKGAKRPGKLTAKEREMIFGEPAKQSDKYVKALPEKWRPSSYSVSLFNSCFKQWGVIACEKRKSV